VLGVLVFAIHIMVIPTFHKQISTGAEGMMGAEGKVVEPLHPGGSVLVTGERWKATSVEGDIDAGESVEIVGIEGLTLKVRRKGP